MLPHGPARASTRSPPIPARIAADRARSDVHATLHPGGIAHGPHPGTVEASIGKKGTEELAVMVDTFRPLRLTETALANEDADYMLSWQPERHG